MYRIHAGRLLGLTGFATAMLWACLAAAADPWQPPQLPAPGAPAVTRDADVPTRKSPLAARAAAAASTAYSHGDPTAEEQYMLEIINRARANPAAEGLRLQSTTDPDILAAYAFFQVDTAKVAAEFAGYPARPPLAFNASLIAAARAHSQDMALNNFQDHVGSDGSSLVTRVERAGYTGWNALGENVYAYAKSVFYGHAGFNVDWGEPDVGHRMNIMNFSPAGPVYTEVGIGIIPETTSSTSVGPLVVTEDFALRSGQLFVVGVVYNDVNRDGFYSVGEGVGGVTITTSQGNYAYTSASGGYAIPLAASSGNITVRAEGGALGAAQEHTLALAGTNVKVDFVAGTRSAGTLDLNQHGLTGSWYQPATSGQGLEAEVFPDQTAPGVGQIFLSWFTYDNLTGAAEHQRWYTLAGQAVSGQPKAMLTIYQNTGGNFDAPPIIVSQAVGNATLSFDTCSSGQLMYSFTDGTNRAGTIALTRLTQNVTCSDTTPHPTDPDFALSGNWFDRATSGQGLTAEVNPKNSAFFAAWYTYAPNGSAAGAAGQRWYTAQGDFAPGLRSIPVQIYETTGGMFDTPTPLGQKTVLVGTGTMAFQSCSAATFSYSFTMGAGSGLSGAINLTRVGLVPAGCTQ